MHISDRKGFTFEQVDPEDDLLSLDIIRTVVQQSSELYSETKNVETSLRYGSDIHISKCVNGTKFVLNPANETIVSEDLLFDMLQEQKCRIEISRPHEFSASLAKLMCLGDELYETATRVKAELASQGSGRGEVLRAD